MRVADDDTSATFRVDGKRFEDVAVGRVVEGFGLLRMSEGRCATFLAEATGFDLCEGEERTFLRAP